MPVENWKQHYSVVPQTLERVKHISGVASVFNANLDAIVKVRPDQLIQWWSSLGKPDLSQVDSKSIKSPVDVLKGLLLCFKDGIAQEWLVQNVETYQWLKDVIGHEKIQMGGQGGIIANVMSVCGAQNVYAHTAAQDELQASQFIDRDNLWVSDQNGQWAKAHDTLREGDEPLIHWILEFDKGDQITLGDQSYTCPKSNRFIATFDPLNFDLQMAKGFHEGMLNPKDDIQLILMSGFHMLTETLSDGSSGIAKLRDTWSQVKAWKQSHPKAMIHLEFASTQDLSIRQGIAEYIAPEVDSIGLNEQELIDILNISGETDLANACADKMDSPTMFKGCLKLFNKFKPYRMQLHMFGLYFTITSESNDQVLEKMRTGMCLAATLAASKAGTGSIENEDNLLWAHGQKIWGAAVEECQALDAHLQAQYQLSGLAESGYVKHPEWSCVVLPTILIEKPITLVGMGDTISSLSLLGSIV